jgi:hypothetical protein
MSKGLRSKERKPYNVCDFLVLTVYTTVYNLWYIILQWQKPSKSSSKKCKAYSFVYSINDFS